MRELPAALWERLNGLQWRVVADLTTDMLGAAAAERTTAAGFCNDIEIEQGCHYIAAPSSWLEDMKNKNYLMLERNSCQDVPNINLPFSLLSSGWWPFGKALSLLAFTLKINILKWFNCRKMLIFYILWRFFKPSWERFFRNAWMIPIIERTFSQPKVFLLWHLQRSLFGTFIFNNVGVRYLVCCLAAPSLSGALVGTGKCV